MGTETIQVSGVIHASPERIYQAWLDSDEHTRFTGGKASVESGIGGRFTAWDGYIEGTTLELEPGRRIVQAWRTTEFPSESPDSRVEIHFQPVDEGTRIMLVHTEIPTGQGGQYEQGWKEHYLEPLARYFANQFGTEVVGVIEDTVAPPVESPSAAPQRKPKPKAAIRRAPAKRAKSKRAGSGKKRAAKPKKARGRKVAPKKKSARKSASKSKSKSKRRKSRR